MRQMSVILFILLSALWASAGAAVSTPHPAFALAVISEEPSGLSDVFFAVLADVPGATLVERDELDRIMQEAKLAFLTRVDPVELGHLAKADALVIVRRNDRRLFVRLVETLRGVRLFEAVGAASAESAEDLALIVGRQLEKRAQLLASAESSRRYVAIDPMLIRKTREHDRYPEFESLGDLLAVGLSARPDVVCVERESVDHLEFEKGLDGQAESNELTHADWLLRGVCEIRDPLTAGVILQLQSLKDGTKKHNRPFEVTVDRIDQSLSAMMAWIAVGMDVDSHASPGADISGEAETQFLLGEAYGARGLRDRGLRCLRVAHMLDRGETRYTERLASTLVGGVGESTARLAKMQELIEAMDLCQYTLGTRTCCFNDSYHHNTYPWNDLPKFLQTVPGDLDASGRELVTRFRRRLRAYMEWLYGYEEGTQPTRGLPWLAVMCPFFFDAPEDAMAYMRVLLEVGDPDWLRLSYSNFLAVGYWDRVEARALWEAFLRDIRDQRDGAAKYYAMRSMAMLKGGYGGNPPAAGKQAVRDLFTWLAADPARYGHIRHYMSREVWDGFAHMDIAFQRRYLGPLMMPRALGAGSEVAHEEVLQALERVYGAYPDDPDVRTETREHLSAYLRKWAGSISSFNHTKLVELLETAHVGLLPLADAGLLASREGIALYSDGLDPVFDYIEDVPAEYRDGFLTDIGRYGLCMDPPFVWISWFIYKDYREDPRREQARIIFVQFDMRSRSTRVSAIPAAWGSCHKALLRWRDYLCLAAYSAVRIVPFDPVTETLAVDRAATVRGLPPLGTTAQDVTCLVPGKDHLYIGTTPGILFRWAPDMDAVEQVVRHDILAPGPLNDTNPYTVAEGRYDARSDAMEFYIQSPRGHPKPGWWRYAPQASSPWEWVAGGEPETQPVLPSWRVTGTGIVEQGLEFVSETGKPIPVARATGHVRTQVRWCDKAAIWVVQSGNKTFDGPMRMYMIERGDWPDEGPPTE